jgi:hypothetical protein
MNVHFLIPDQKTLFPDKYSPYEIYYQSSRGAAEKGIKSNSHLVFVKKCYSFTE